MFIVNKYSYFYGVKHSDLTYTFNERTYFNIINATVQKVHLSVTDSVMHVHLFNGRFFTLKEIKLSVERQ